MLLEADCNADGLYKAIEEILADEKQYEKMCQAMRQSCVADSSARICDIMQQLIKK